MHLCGSLSIRSLLANADIRPCNLCTSRRHVCKPATCIIVAMQAENASILPSTGWLTSRAASPRESSCCPGMQRSRQRRYQAPTGLGASCRPGCPLRSRLLHCSTAHVRGAASLAAPGWLLQPGSPTKLQFSLSVLVTKDAPHT